MFCNLVEHDSIKKFNCHHIIEYNHIKKFNFEWHFVKKVTKTKADGAKTGRG